MLRGTLFQVASLRHQGAFSSHHIPIPSLSVAKTGRMIRFSALSNADMDVSTHSTPSNMLTKFASLYRNGESSSYFLKAGYEYNFELDLPLTPIFSGVRFRPTFSAKFGVELNYVFASAMAELKGTLSDEAFNMQLSNALSTLNSHKQQGVE